MKQFFVKYRGWVIVLSALALLLLPDIAEARKGGGSFGGRRGGGGFGGYKRSAPSPTYRSTPRTSPAPRSSYSQPRKSFGGTRLSSPQQYTMRYGAPRKSWTMNGVNSQGLPQNYVVHGYGGYGDRFMTGYLLGSAPWFWSMPFHPAFYYSRPYTVQNPDGTISAYPPTFSWGKLLFVLAIVGGIIFILSRAIRARRRTQENYSQSSFV